MRKIVVLFCLIGVLASGTGWAYTDRIDAPASEVFDVVKKVFSQYELADVDEKKMKIVTDWHVGHSRISKRLAFIGSKISKTLELRSRFIVTVTPGMAYTEVQIEGDYQTRSTADDKPWRWWNKNSGGREEYYKEKDLFFQVLSAIEKQRNPELAKQVEIQQNPPVEPAIAATK